MMCPPAVQFFVRATKNPVRRTKQGLIVHWMVQMSHPANLARQLVHNTFGPLTNISPPKPERLASGYQRLCHFLGRFYEWVVKITMRIMDRPHFQVLWRNGWCHVPGEPVARRDPGRFGNLSNSVSIEDRTISTVKLVYFCNALDRITS